MNKRIKTMVISLLLILFMPMAKLSAQVSVWDGTWEPWTHGTGTEADPFLIENAQQLAYLAYRVNNGLDANGGHVSNHDYHYKLMVDVDLNGSENFQWTPIGYWNSDTDYQCFSGHFDGNNHTVSGIYIHSSLNRAGFFGVTDGVSIRNLNIAGDSVVTSKNHAGGLICYAKNTTVIIGCSSCISNIFSFSEYLQTGVFPYSGGFVGYSDGTMIMTNCLNYGDLISAENYHSCNYSNNTYSIYSFAGGLVGYSNGTAKITNCYNLENVSSSSSGWNSYCVLYSYSGGIIGYSRSSIITNCYNIGTTITEMNSGLYYAYNGGIVNGNNNVVTNCYYLDICGGNNTYGGQPMSADAMKSEEFVDVLNNGTCSWDFDNTNINNGYPILTMITSSAETYQATEVATTSTTLHGSVYIENTSMISKGFEYRKIGDLNYTSINITNNSDYFSYNLTGLATNTTYEYRTFLNVADCDVTSYGDTKTFTLSLLNNDTICIYDADMLRWVSEQCNSGITFDGYCIKLMNDITLPLNVPNNMTSIGSYPDHPFKGTFDGNGKLITNLYIDQPNTPYQGFFGYTLNANLYNVGLVNITASGRNYTGGMVAYAENTYMRDCYVNGGTLFALSYCGGLVGYQEQGTNSIISGCYNTCEVTGNNYVGGLIGFSNYSTVRNSYVAGRVSAQGEPVGAIIGGANEVLMYYCYFSTELTGQTNAIGWNNIGKDGEGMTNAQMRDPQFVATLNQGLSVHVWRQDYTLHINNGFPILQWQQSTGVDENDALAVAVYPNPANDKVTIEGEDIRHITISNLLGQTIFDGNDSGNVFEYDFSKHKAGIYLIRIETASGVAVKKVSVTR